MQKSCVLLTALAFAFMARFAPFAQMAIAADWYVATNGTGDGTNNWANATNSIQGAIDASSASDIVWVSNGVYETGGRTNYPSGTVLTNRVVIDKAITVRSANNDPTNTIIKGAWDPSTTNGPAAVRCVYITDGSSLIGFTLTNGATLQLNQPSSGTNNNHHGGGVWCQSTNTLISNCVLVGNSAARNGGGSAWGTLRDCTLTRNWAGYGGGGSFSGTLYNCTIATNIGVTYGGGTYWSAVFNSTVASNWGGNGGGTTRGTVYNSTIVRNSSSGTGGGVLWSAASNCTLIGNSTAGSGGGVGYASLYNCTIVSNKAAGYGGGAYIIDGSKLCNCTIVGNMANTSDGGVSGGYLYNCISWSNNTADSAVAYYSCGVGYTNGGSIFGNITNDPLFVNYAVGNYRLRANSPCVNTGTNGSWTTNSVDLDGRKRIQYGTVDMGAYERLNKGTICGVH